MRGAVLAQLRALLGSVLRQGATAAIASGAVRAVLSGGLGAGQRDLQQTLRLGLRRVVLYGFATIAGLTGAAFLIAALYQWLTSLWGGPAAAAAIGGGLLLLGVGVAAAGYFLPSPRPAPPPQSAGAPLSAAWESLLRDGKKLLGDLAGMDWPLLLVAFIAGLVLTGNGKAAESAGDDENKAPSKAPPDDIKNK